jgi:hypothetical protein
MPKPTARYRAAIKAGRPIAALAIIDHPDGVVRIWTGIGTLDYAGEAWEGIGILGTISPLSASTETVISDFELRIAGVPAYAAQFINANVRGRSAQVLLAALDDHLNVVPGPIEVGSGVMDYQTLETSDDGTCSIAVTVIGGLWTLDQALNQAWTTEEQIKIYPGDTGLDAIPSLVNKNINWTKDP